jgi:hypothetical protein
LSKEKIIGVTTAGKCVRLFPEGNSFFYLDPDTGKRINVIRHKKLTEMIQILEEREN